MINNRHGPHPAVSYYRSGAPPGCGLEWKNGASCDPRLLSGAVATHELQVASCGLRVATHELRVAAHDCYRGRGRGAPGPHRIRDDDFVNCLSEHSQHKEENSYPRSFGKDTEKILCIRPFAALCDSLAPDDYRDTERILYMVNNSYELVMT
ncbi:hypothetical protein BA6E_11053 [Bacteroidales bacterium 6E]|nr:hypothetical protein BA6E_11053 [Bacteroidales bacterium 6E]